MNLNQQIVAYCLIWRLEIDIRTIIFSDLIHKLQNGKKNRELNLYYTSFLSLILEKLLGGNYVSNDLSLVKLHTIIPASFKKPIPPTSKPKSPYKVKVILPKKQVTETQYAEVTVGTVNANKSLVAFELAEEQGNQPSATKAKMVLDQNIKEEVKDVGFVAIEKIKIIKSYQATTIFGSQFIRQSSLFDKDKDVEEADASESLSGLRSMPDDNLAFIFCFESQDFADHVSEEDTKTLHASTNKPTLSDPFGYLHAELGIINTKIVQLESNISKKVAENIKSSLPVMVADTLKEQLLGLLSDALKDTIPQLIKDSIKSFVLELISEEGEVREKNRESPAKEKDAQHPNQTNGGQDSGTTIIAIIQGEQPLVQVIPNAGQAPFVNKENTLVLHTSEEKSSEEDTSEKKKTDDEPPTKKLKFLILPSLIPSPTPSKSIMTEPPKVTEASKITLDQYTKHLSKTISSIFSSTPPREPTPPRDSTKGKEVVIIEEQVIDQEKKLGLLPRLALTTFGMTAKEKKRKRTEILKEVFVTENITVDRMQRNLIRPPENQIKVDSEIADEMFRNLIYVIKTFGGNEATKKTKKNLLKQQYGNFKAEGSETLEQTFNRLQVIVGQLQFIDVEIEQNNLNQKFLTSLALEWLMHTIVWRNRSDLDTMSLDDLYNHLKVYESEVQKKQEQNSQNKAFISSAKHSSRNEDGNTASTNVPTASASVATISQDTACAYIASQSNGSQIKFKDINQIDEDDMEEMDIKWNMALLSMRANNIWKKTCKKISI
nr:hypothetical protein [Tanacetum cinerariifolium]